MKTNVEKSLIPWVRWLRIRRAVLWSCWGLGLGSALGWSLGMAGIARARLIQAEFIWLVVMAALAGSLLLGMIAFLLPVRIMRAARYFDRSLQLKERLSTALEIQEQAHLGQTALEDLQVKDALATLGGIRIHHRLKLQVSRSGLILGGLFLLAVLPTTWFAADLFQEASSKRRTQAALEEQAAAVAQLMDDVQTSEALPPQLKPDIVRVLEESLGQLENAPSLEAGLAVLDTAEASLRAMNVPPTESTIERLQAIAQSLPNNTSSASSMLAESLAQGSLQAAADQLQTMDPSAMSDEERADLASSLQSLSEAVLESSPGLAGELSTASERLASGELAGSEMALQAAAESLQTVDRAETQSAEIADLADSLANVQGALSATNQTMAGSGNSFEQTDSGSGPAAIAGPVQELTDANQGQGPSGSGRGDPAGSAQPGSAVESNPIDQANDPGDLGLAEYSEIYSPLQSGLESLPGELVVLPSSEVPRNLVTGTNDPAAPIPGVSRVPYMEVYPYYEGLWRQAIDTGNVPPALRSLVQRYFVGLEP